MRAGFVVDGPLSVAMADAKRGLERGRGPATRSAEVKPSAWDELQIKVASGEEQLDRQGDSPRGGLHVWGIGTGWLLREVELALLNVHSETIKIQADGSVTLRIATSKTDPAGRGAARTMACTCAGRQHPSCPACSAKVLLSMAVEEFCDLSLSSDEAKLIPLVGTLADPRVVVSKAAFCRAAQADATLLYRIGLLHSAPSEVTGHFMRRSGAKDLARRGFPLARIQWLGRWGSMAVLTYVEEAAEESPAGLQPLGGTWEELQGDLAMALGACPEGPAPVGEILSRPQVRDAVTRGGSALRRLEALEDFALSVQRDLGTTAALAHELDHLVRPASVLNTQTKVVHKALRTERLDPESASTLCGWRWARSNRSRPLSQTEYDRAEELGWTRCPRCT